MERFSPPFAGNLVDLVNINNAALSLGNITVSSVNEAQQNVLTSSPVARLGEWLRRPGEGHIQLLRQGCRQVGFTATVGPSIRIFDLPSSTCSPRSPKECGKSVLGYQYRGCACSGCTPPPPGCVSPRLTDDVVVEVAVNFARVAS